MGRRRGSVLAISVWLSGPADPLFSTSWYCHEHYETPSSSEQVPRDDTWDLASLFVDDGAWEREFQAYEGRVNGYDKYRGRLGESASVLADCLDFDCQLDRLGERLGVYAHLKTAEDQANSAYQRMVGRFENVAARAAQAASYIRPEVLALPSARVRELLADKRMKPYRLLLERLLRYKPHTLGRKEEELLAMQSEMAQAASQAFRQLNDADLKFGLVTNEHGERIELTNATFMQLLHSPQAKRPPGGLPSVLRRSSRRTRTRWPPRSPARSRRDVYYARARRLSQFAGGRVVSRQRAAVGLRQPDRSRCAGTCRPCTATTTCGGGRCGCSDIHHYDTYVPILSDLRGATHAGTRPSSW